MYQHVSDFTLQHQQILKQPASQGLFAIMLLCRPEALLVFCRSVLHGMQVCYTGRFEAYLPRWSIFRRASPIMQVVIDRDRQILYTRSQSGAIGVSCLHAAFMLGIYARCITKVYARLLL